MININSRFNLPFLVRNLKHRLRLRLDQQILRLVFNLQLILVPLSSYRNGFAFLDQLAAALVLGTRLHVLQIGSCLGVFLLHHLEQLHLLCFQTIFFVLVFVIIFLLIEILLVPLLVLFHLFLVEFLVEFFLIQIVDVLVNCWQPVDQFLLNGTIDLGRFLRGGLPIFLPLLVFFINPHQLLLRVIGADLQFSLPSDHLMQLGKALLAFVPLEFAPELKLLINNLERLLVIPRQLDLIPKLLR